MCHCWWAPNWSVPRCDTWLPYRPDRLPLLIFYHSVGWSHPRIVRTPHFQSTNSEASLCESWVKIENPHKLRSTTLFPFLNTWSCFCESLQGVLALSPRSQQGWRSWMPQVAECELCHLDHFYRLLHLRNRHPLSWSWSALNSGLLPAC